MSPEGGRTIERAFQLRRLEIPAVVPLGKHVRERRGVGQGQVARGLGSAIRHDGDEEDQRNDAE